MAGMGAAFGADHSEQQLCWTVPHAKPILGCAPPHTRTALDGLELDCLFDSCSGIIF